MSPTFATSAQQSPQLLACLKFLGAWRAVALDNVLDLPTEDLIFEVLPASLQVPLLTSKDQFEDTWDVGFRAHVATYTVE